jgi:hypothetical protein
MRSLSLCLYSLSFTAALGMAVAWSTALNAPVGPERVKLANVGLSSGIAAMVLLAVGGASGVVSREVD